MNKRAFTLAETLITLAIIGVIAALTIPTLHSKYKKVQTVTRLKQTYAKLKTATDLAIAETRLQPEEWLTDAELALSDKEKKEIIYTKYIKPYLKTHSYKDGTFYDDSGVKYTFRSGQDSGFWKIETYYGNLTAIAADIDGDKGKNQNGYDIFNFLYKKRKQYFGMPAEQVFGLWNCGFTTKDFTQYKDKAYNTPGIYPDCNQDMLCCADIIMREGWQIKDDYPIKF